MTQTPTRFTTPLLELITQQSLDADYEHVAAQVKGADSGADGARGRSVVAVAVVVAFGALLAVAALQTGRNASVVSAGRDQLVSRIEDRRHVVADQRNRIADLRASIASSSGVDRVLRTEERSLTGKRDELAALTGWAIAQGRGLRLTLDDNGAIGDEGLVHDSDLALAADALWRGGATAIAVNGERVTALSAFRNSSEVIRINGVSLSAPYVLNALGDADRMREALATTPSGRHFSAVVSDIGLSATLQNVDDLRIPAARAFLMRLRYATAMDAASSSVQKEAEK